MSYTDGITINGVHSFRDYGLVIASRMIGLPKKNTVRKTVPFMNGFYDFSTIAGEVTWGEREIEYAFDIVGNTVEEMDIERTEVVNWLCNVHDADIYDDSMPEYHFHGSYDGYTMTEDGEGAQLSVKFVCQPFRIGSNGEEVL